jgi:hypothetical protein
MARPDSGRASLFTAPIRTMERFTSFDTLAGSRR